MVFPKSRIEVSNYIYLLFVGYAFLIPFTQVVSTIYLILCLFLSIVFFKKDSFFLQKELLVPLCLYFFMMFSLLWSDYTSTDFFRKYSQLFFIPTLFIINYKLLNKKKIETIIKGFIIGCLLSILFCNIYATYRAATFYPGGFYAIVQPGHDLIKSISDGGNLYFGRYFSIFHQTVYFSAFLTIALMFLIDKPFKNQKINIVFFLILLVGVFQVSNRSSFLVIFFLFTFYLIKKYKKFSIKTNLLLITSLIIILTIFLSNPRFNKTLKSIYASSMNINPNATSSHGVRLLVWKASLDLIKEAPVFGYGIGDYDIVLEDFYKTNKYKSALNGKLNSHNAYLSLMVQVGVVGLLLFLLMFCNLFFSFKFNGTTIKFMTQSLSMILFIFCMFESVLERYSGVLLISFFYCLLTIKASLSTNND